MTTPKINDTSSDHQYEFVVSELTDNRQVTLPLLTGNDEFVFKDHTQTLTGKTLTAPTISAGSATGGQIKFKEGTDNGTHELTLKCPASIDDINVTLPSSAGTIALDTVFSTTSKGLVPTAPASTSKFLRADGTWVVPSGTGTTGFTPSATGIEFDGATSGDSITTTLSITGPTSSSKTITFPDADGNVVLDTNTVTLSGKTLTAPKFVDGGFIADANGAECIVFGTTATAVNEIKITNAAANDGPTIATQGDDSNIDLNLNASGTGSVKISKVDIDGGAIDSTTIGGAGQAAGSFTTLSASSTSTFTGQVTLGGDGNFTLKRADNGSGASGVFNINGQLAHDDGAGGLQNGGAVTIQGGTGANGGVLGDVNITGNEVKIQGGYSSTGVSISSAGNIQTDGTLTVDSTSTLTGDVTVGGTSAFSMTRGTVGTGTNGGSFTIQGQSSGLNTGDTGGNLLLKAGGGATKGQILIETFSQLIINGLPTSDPNVTNAVWNDGGTLKISSPGGAS